MNQFTSTIEKAWVDYQRKLLSYIRSKVSNTEDAEDILNDVFVKLTLSVSHNKVPDNVSAWLYHVAKNKVVDYYRGKKHHEPLPEELTQDKEVINIIKQLSNCMVPMIKALPKSYQRPLMLSEIEGLTHKEVAEALDLSMPAVKSRILRGREKLHKSMVSCCSVQRNSSGDAIDFEAKISHPCKNC